MYLSGKHADWLADRFDDLFCRGQSIVLWLFRALVTALIAALIPWTPILSWLTPWSGLLWFLVVVFALFCLFSIVMTPLVVASKRQVNSRFRFLD